jgi:adenosine deaminase/aminodeoxyfutalosine deaminase
MIELYRQWKKADLHVHLEGSIEPETVAELDSSITVDAARDKYRTSNFAEFIEAYKWVNQLLRSPADYALITRRLLERLAAENVVYAEINVSVGVMLWKQQPVDAIFYAIQSEAQESSIQVRWIFDAIRHFGAEHGMQVAKHAVEHHEAGVAAFGIGGDELRGPVEGFYDVFEYVRENGLAVVPHAGETGGAESVWAAIKGGAKRIGHGIRAADDAELMTYLRDNDIPLEICITSNVCTGAVSSLEGHPVRRLFDAGVPLTLNTDDPGMFGTTLSREYAIAARQFGFTEDELAAIANNGFRYALGYFQGAR